jgi:signal peptidase I
MPPSPRRLIALAAALCCATAVWLVLAPPMLAGRTSYAIVTGSSMEPHLSAGDLVLLRAHDDYDVGDVVGYRDSGLDRMVLHRIAASEGGRLVLKGDNNNFTDPGRPAMGEVVGREWLSIPVAGRAVEWLRLPPVLGVLAGTITLGLLLGGTATRRRGTRGAPRPPPAGARPSAGGNAAMACVALAGVGLLGCAALAAVTLTRPTSGPVQVAGAYSESGAFAYSGRAARGPVYPSGRVATGDAIFLRQVDAVRFRFGYALDARAPREIAGTGRMSARLSDGSGWTRTIPLQPPRYFTGDDVTLAGILDLGRLQRLVAAFERQTGARGDSYALTIVPRIAADGTLDGRPLATAFGPELEMRLDDTRLRLEETSEADGAPSNALTRTRTGSVTRTGALRMEAAGLGILVTTARLIALLGGLACLVVILALGPPLIRALRGDEHRRIVLRHGHRMIEGRTEDVEPPRSVVALRSMDDLARTAERYERLIVTETVGRRRRYSVEHEGVAYRFETAR